MSYVCMMTTPQMTRDFVVRSDFWGPGSLERAERVLEDRISDFIGDCHSECNVRSSEPLNITASEFVERDPDGRKEWHRAEFTRARIAGVVVKRAVLHYYEGPNRVYYAIQLELEEKDVCETEPCKEEPAATVPVILAKMFGLSENMTKMEREMTALVQELRDLE